MLNKQDTAMIKKWLKTHSITKARGQWPQRVNLVIPRVDLKRNPKLLDGKTI